MSYAGVEISIILPVYNVEGYIDQCMESIVHQSFRDFEALLVNDGSTDGSLAKCREWELRDNRIRVIEKPNGGVSSARNCGIEQARGTYLAFVDPDDWIDERYPEILHARAVETGADFVECDLWRYSNRSGNKIHRYCGQRMGVPYTLSEHMKYGPTASYKAISRRSLWIDNDIRFPSCAFESPAIYALVLALANRVEYIPEPLYYYRRFRENSLIETAYAHKDGSANNTLGVEAMEHLVKAFDAHGLSGRYADDLPGIVVYGLNDILAMQHPRKTPEYFAALVSNYRQFVGGFLPSAYNEPYLTWGGYNLDKICQDISALHDPSCRFNFSSLISLLGPKGEAPVIRHKNRYRELMLEHEANLDFFDVLEARQPACIVLDLIEERHDIIEWEGRYLTLSDALEGAEGIELDACRVILRQSEECERLFAEAAHLFAEELHCRLPECRVIVVENYLATHVGDRSHKEEFEDVDGIRNTNAHLLACYDVFCNEVSEAIRIPAYQCEDYFTDAGYEYGAVPSHLNAIVNQRIAALVEGELL